MPQTSCKSNNNNNSNNAKNHTIQHITNHNNTSSIITSMNNNNNNKNVNKHHRITRKKKRLNVPQVKYTVGDKSQQAPIRKKEKLKQRHDTNDPGENFVAPDGGWGWLVAIAAGVNVLVTFAVAQQFGLLFRDHMMSIGLNNSQLTTIINVQIAVSSFTGLLNGPLFRSFTYRQVSLFGSFLTFLGLLLAVFADTFIFYLCTFSCLYGTGRGLTVSASSLAVNTFFKNERRTATAYQFGVAGLGPIFLPYLATFLLQCFGVQGTILVFCGISLHTFPCSLIYQPVRWHVVNSSARDTGALHDRTSIAEEVMESIADPDTPILPRANDGWYGSKHSLNLAYNFRSRLSTLEKEKDREFQIEQLRRLNTWSVNMKTHSSSIDRCIKEEFRLNDYGNKLSKSTEVIADLDQLNLRIEHERRGLPFYMKVVIFFDLDLLRDLTFINLAIGLTVINFVEVNFAILTPFILADFGFVDNQIAIAMSVLGFCDLVIRFLIPVITARMKFNNKYFLIFGIIGMCIGRVLLSFTRNFYTMMGLFIFMGMNKALRTVFCSLIIPGHIPLNRLAAATGLQLLMAGLFSMIVGPLIGWIRDSTNYVVTLNVLNSLCLLAILSWIAEIVWRKHYQQQQPNSKDIK